jgi:hypothetical protein
MNTLVIHPQDQTTEFLTKIYKNLKNKNVIIGGVNKEKVGELIQTYNRCLFLGHGTPNGLMSVGMFQGSWGFIIDTNMVSSLINQKDNMYIWCHADKFVRNNNLKGLFCGMFISEVSEGLYYGFTKVSEEEVTESNNVFGEIVGSNINKTNEEIYDILKTEYVRFGKTNRIGKYNSDRIYYR